MFYLTKEDLENTVFEEETGFRDTDGEQWVVLYYNAPRSVLNDMYPDADYATISLEFPKGFDGMEDIGALISPTKVEVDVEFDYDYSELGVSDETVSNLLQKWYAAG